MADRPTSTNLPEAPDEYTSPQNCPHCEQQLVKMLVPEMSNFDSAWMYVCFNDDCGYFKRSGEWMQQQYASPAMYRYKLDPFTGETGPLPVWSADAMRDLIVKGNE